MQKSASESTGSSGPSGAKPNYPLESVDNALRLLGLFSERGPMRLSEISDALGVGRSTAHRLLAMLVYHQYVEQEPDTKVYRFGPELVEVGLAALRQFDIATYMRPALEELAAELNETVVLGVRFGTSVLVVDALEPDRALRVGGRIGSKQPAHATAAGKALLSMLPPDRLPQLYPEASLERLTNKTLRTRARLTDELQRVRDAGYATDIGESDAEVGSVAGLIRNQSGTIRAAVGVTAPVTRCTEAWVAKASGEILRVCAAAQGNLHPDFG